MYTIKDGEKMLLEGNTFAVLGKEIYVSKERGIKPIVELICNNPDILKGAAVCDKVIGKAAALLLAYAGIKELYTPVLSFPAAEVLKNNRISYRCEKTVERIKNRAGDGLCPMETMAMEIHDPKEAFEVFCDKIYMK